MFTVHKSLALIQQAYMLCLLAQLTQLKFLESHVKGSKEILNSRQENASHQYNHSAAYNIASVAGGNSYDTPSTRISKLSDKRSDRINTKL